MSKNKRLELKQKWNFESSFVNFSARTPSTFIWNFFPPFQVRAVKFVVQFVTDHHNHYLSHRYRASTLVLMYPKKPTLTPLHNCQGNNFAIGRERGFAVKNQTVLKMAIFSESRQNRARGERIKVYSNVNFYL